MVTLQKYTRVWIFPVLVTAILVFQGASSVQAVEDKSKKATKAVVAPTKKVPCGSNALGPQPEPPDKPGSGSKELGPQPEPPDMPDPGSRSLGPQPEPPDKELQVK